MSSILSGLAGVAKNASGEAVAFGLGFALGRVLEPEGVALVQEAWKVAPIKAPDAVTLAAGVAQGQVDPARAAEWASESGYGHDQFNALVDIANTGPALGMAYQAWRRGELTDAQFETALKRTGLEDAWVASLKALKDTLLEPAELAKAIHRGIIAGHGLLVAEPSSTPGRVPTVPPSDINPVHEAAGSGMNAERLRVLVGNAGLPPGPMQMLQLLNRGHITEDDFSRGVGESNLRNEWGPFLLELRRHLLTPSQYVEAFLRGWIDHGAMVDGAALSGLTAEDADLLAQLSGRPLSWHQVWIGLQRGGKYDGPTTGIDPAFLKALRESNVRPEWYSIAWAQRYSYPSSFVLRAMAQAGDITRAETETILLYEGWEPTLAHKVAGEWAGGGTVGGKAETLSELEDDYAGGYLTEQELRTALTALGYTGHVQDHLVHLNDARRIKRYREKVVDAIAAAYTSFKVTDATATAELAAVNVAGEATSLLLNLWQKQRLSTITLLTAAQVKKAFSGGLITRDVALTELENRHYTAADAATFLDE